MGVEIVCDGKAKNTRVSFDGVEPTSCITNIDIHIDPMMRRPVAQITVLVDKLSVKLDSDDVEMLEEVRASE